MSDNSEDKRPLEGNLARQAREAREAQERKPEGGLSQQEMKSSFEASRKGIPEEVVVLVIAYDTLKGTVQVQGPIANKHMAYAMLELGRDCIHKYNEENIPGISSV